MRTTPSHRPGLASRARLRAAARERARGLQAIELVARPDRGWLVGLGMTRLVHRETTARTIPAVTCAIVIALALGVGVASPVLAECTLQTNAFPRFRDVAPKAETVVIGTVIEELRGHEGTVATFRLRVDEVLRGDPPATLDILGLRSGLPLEGSQSCRENAFLYARVGDVLALALDGRLDGRDGVNTAAWIEGRPASPIESNRKLTRAAVRRAAGSAPAGDIPTPLTSTLTKEDAIARVTQLYGEDTLGATEVEAYLESATLESSLGTLEPIEDRAVWNVHLSGMGIVDPGPVTEDGTPAASVVIDNVYVFLDADTGEFLVSIWTE
jgi:hypothetical protein